MIGNLKIGDKVKIKPFSYLVNNDNNISTCTLRRLAGKIVKVTKLNSYHKGIISVEGGETYWWKKYQYTSVKNRWL